MSRRAEFGLGATFKRPDGSLHNAANMERQEYAEPEPRGPRRNPATINNGDYGIQRGKNMGITEEEMLEERQWSRSRD